MFSASKSAPPSTTTAPRPPRPPSTALPPPVPSSPSIPPPPRTPPPRHLKSPIAIAASATRTLAVRDRARGGPAGGGESAGGEEEGEEEEEGKEDLSLDAYMRLPPSAYSALDPELIRRGGSVGAGGGVAPTYSEPSPAPSSSVPTALFTLAVPRASMLGIWLEPIVSVRVEGASPKGIDRRAGAGGGGGKGSSSSSSSGGGNGSGSGGSGGNGSVSSSGGSGSGGSDRVRLVSTECDLRGSPAVEKLKINEVFALRFEAVLTWTAGGTISVRVSTEVWAEPVGPFTVVPRSVIGGAGDALLRALTAALLPSFLGKLGKDYERWSRDPGYRREREAMAREAEERERERRRKGGAAVAGATGAAKIG